MNIEINNEDGSRFYSISYPTSDGKLWLSNEEGEGMSFDEETLFAILDRFFKGTF